MQCRPSCGHFSCRWISWGAWYHCCNGNLQLYIKYAEYQCRLVPISSSSACGVIDAFPAVWSHSPAHHNHISCCTSQNTFKRTRHSLSARAKVLRIPIVSHNQMQPCGCAVKVAHRPWQRRCTVGHTAWSVSSVSRAVFGNVVKYQKDALHTHTHTQLDWLIWIE